MKKIGKLLAPRMLSHEDEATDPNSEKARQASVERQTLRTLPHGWRQHPQQMRPQQRYAPYSIPPQAPFDMIDHPGYADGDLGPYSDPRSMTYDDPGSGTNVSVNNNGNFYRPWKEELALSFGKSVGNFFAFPIRLIGNIFEGIVSAGIGVIKLILIAVIAPTLLYTGMQMYHAGQNGESSTAAAADVGKEAIVLVGAVLGGIWDGIFGGDEDTTPEGQTPE